MAKKKERTREQLEALVKKLKTALKTEVDNHREWASGLEEDLATKTGIIKALELSHEGMAAQLAKAQKRDDALDKRCDFMSDLRRCHEEEIKILLRCLNDGWRLGEIKKTEGRLLGANE